MNKNTNSLSETEFDPTIERLVHESLGSLKHLRPHFNVVAQKDRREDRDHLDVGQAVEVRNTLRSFQQKGLLLTDLIHGRAVSLREKAE
jgi:hypothetical protein